MRHFQENALKWNDPVCSICLTPPALTSRTRFTYAKQRWEKPSSPLCKSAPHRIHACSSKSQKRFFFFFFNAAICQKSIAKCCFFSFSFFFSDIIRELSSSTELEHSKPRSQKWGEKKATRSTLLNNELSRWMEGHIGWNHGIFCKLCIFSPARFRI